MSFSLIDKRYNNFVNGEISHHMHDTTKCEILHVHNDDLENAFVFAVPSYPSNSSGVSHILEHSVLSGSQRYQLKSPFFHFEQGSCRTYLNAMTYPDRALYVGASTVKADFFNLFNMYGDAVWFPLLRKEVFHREGFLLSEEKYTKEQGNESSDRNTSSNGIVYNEMKGDYSDKNSLLLEAIYQQLFPDMFYCFDSGGNPKEIPLLQYEQFLEFHAQWYRPEYTKILLYGNIPTQEHLVYIEQEFLSRWNKEVHPSYEIPPLQKHVCLDKDVFINVPLSQENKEAMGTVDISWLLGKNDDPIEMQRALFLHSVLVGIPGAPLRRKLLESGIADDISVLTGLGASLHQLTYTLGLTGFHPDKNSEVKQFILQSLQEVIQEGIPQSFIDATLSRVEFSLREALTNTTGKISWLSKLARVMVYQQNPLDFADVNNTFLYFKNMLQSSHGTRYLEEYAEKYLVYNEHRITTFACPQKEYTQIQMQQEKELFSQIWQSYSSEEKEEKKLIAKNIDVLNNTEDSPEVLATVPKLSIAELPKKIIVWNEKHIHDNALNIHWIENTRNRLIYMALHFDIASLIEHNEYARYLIPTFIASCTDLGTNKHSYEDIATKIRRITGKLSMSMENLVDLNGSLKIMITLEVSFLEDKMLQVIDLLKELLLDLDFTRVKRLNEIVAEGKTVLRNRLPDAGTSYASIKAGSQFVYSAILDDEWNGTKQYSWLNEKSDTSLYPKELEHIRQSVFTKERLSITLVCKEQKIDTVQQALYSLYQALPSRAYTLHALSASVNGKAGKFAFTYPTQVAFNAMVMPTVSYVSPHYAAYELASKIISQKLIENIRMNQGAYGAGTQLLGAEALLYFYTFRDPTIKDSYDEFFKSIESTAQGKFRESMLSTLIVGTVGEAIKVFSPLRKLRMAQFRQFTGITAQLRQQVRDSLLSLTKQQVTDAANAILSTVHTASFASVCNESFLSQMEWDSIEHLPQ